jgi:hypothetical protein
MTSRVIKVVKGSITSGVPEEVLKAQIASEQQQIEDEITAHEDKECLDEAADQIKDEFGQSVQAAVEAGELWVEAKNTADEAVTQEQQEFQETSNTINNEWEQVGNDNMGSGMGNASQSICNRLLKEPMLMIKVKNWELNVKISAKLKRKFSGMKNQLLKKLILKNYLTLRCLFVPTSKHYTEYFGYYYYSLI